MMMVVVMLAVLLAAVLKVVVVLVIVDYPIGPNQFSTWHFRPTDQSTKCTCIRMWPPTTVSMVTCFLTD